MNAMNANNTNPRILIIDDNPEIHSDFRKVLCRNLSTDNELDELEALFGDEPVDPRSRAPEIQVDSAHQGQEGIEMVQKALEEGRPYSLAFIDVRMPPGLDGIQTTKKIWELDPEIQVVVCSAYSDYTWQDIIHELTHTSRFLVLKKPFESIEVRQLAATLHQRWEDSRYDLLTGLVNRRAYMDHFQLQKKNSFENKTPLSCIMLDLDYFKRVNDDHGHAAGDDVLRTVAQILIDDSRPGDIVCRYGGEELCVLLKNADEKRAVEWADRVRQKIATTPVAKVNGDQIFVSSSFGVYQLENQKIEPATALENADTALRAAKSLGRNRVVTYSAINDPDFKLNSDPCLASLEGITARSVMNPIPSIRQDATLQECAQQLMKHCISSAPVVSTDGKVIGQLTECDLLKSFTDEAAGDLAALDVMNSSVVCYHESTPLHEIFRFLIRVAIPHVVMVRDNCPTGVIARSTLLSWLYAESFPTSAEVPSAIENGVQPISDNPMPTNNA